MHTQTKLTLRLDSDLIKKAKEYSKKTDKSVSQIVADYFKLLDRATIAGPSELPPITKSLKGALKSKKAKERDYKKYLEDKYL